MHDDQHEQDVVQALDPLPGPGFEFPQGGVAGDSEQPHHDHERGKPGPVPQAKAIGPRAAIGRDEIAQEVADPSAAMHLQSEDHVDDAADGRPCPKVTAQIARNWIPLAEQEVGGPDEKRERQEPEGDVAGGESKLPVEGAVADLVRAWTGVVPAATHRSGVIPAMPHRSGVFPAVIHRSALDSVPGKRTTEDVPVRLLVGVEERETHEQDKDDGTRYGEWHMVEKNATTQVATGAKRRIRRTSGRLRTHRCGIPWSLGPPRMRPLNCSWCSCIQARNSGRASAGKAASIRSCAFLTAIPSESGA